jgi:hypothetical protein
MDKLRKMVSFEKLDDGIKGMIKNHYPHGFWNSVFPIQKSTEEVIYVFPLETDQIKYLIKVAPPKRRSKTFDDELYFGTDEDMDTDDTLESRDTLDNDDDSEDEFFSKPSTSRDNDENTNYNYQYGDEDED